MQAIKSGFYSNNKLNDKFFEIISNIFGLPRHGLIEHRTIVKLLTVNEIWCLSFVLHQEKTFPCCIQMWVVLQLNAKNVAFLYFQF
jgi:hypothetical protein